jgi:ParB-like chromosome segregation protein Spo0J
MGQLKDVRSMGESRREPLSSLRLDPHNPRLPAEIQGQGQEDLAVHLELGFDALTVAESIASHGFFESEPLIVIVGDADGEWIVVEGNRRLTALLGLVDPSVRAQFANPGPWDTLAARAKVQATDLVPVVLLPNRAAATPIIGFRHISGILQWQPYAQARYIARLVDEEEMSFADVADMIGIDRTKVGNLYRDQAIAKQARTLGIETGPLEDAFSLLTVAMSTPKLRAHIDAPLGSKASSGENPIPTEKAAQLQELITWIYGDGETEPVIGESREISKLGNVVASEAGLGALRSGASLDAAVQKVKDAESNPKQRLLTRLKAGRNSLTAALDDLSDFADDPEVVEAVDEARASADALLAALEHE